jgi:choline dehydrogenase-like flavoprotein
MGVETDSMAVVDSHARVYGVQGLRVVDASAFPLLPPGHPQSTICKFIPGLETYFLG